MNTLIFRFSRTTRGDSSVCRKVLRLHALLLILLVNLKLVTSAPSQPICDSRVLERYVTEAREAEVAMESSPLISEFPEDIDVPDTKVNPTEWRKLQISRQAADVRKGLALFTKALLRIRGFMADPTLQFSVEKTYSNVRSVTQILRSLNLQDEKAISQLEEKTLKIRTLKKFFSVYTNFLRGKFKLVVSAACRDDVCLNGNCKFYN
ncbi:erythropoietin-like [Ascaphus truei]|uniref:erythropoietin-like n=1 Tax=Ascaphus truei TaxID=8439 RepID=UPI003F5A6B79